MTQEQMAELFGRERSVITKHLRNIFLEEELEESSVCANFARIAGDDVPPKVGHQSNSWGSVHSLDSLYFFMMQAAHRLAAQCHPCALANRHLNIDRD